MKIFFVALSVFLSVCLTAQVTVVKNITQVDSIIKNSTQPLVVNFWATFCVPCVQELPYFEKARKKYAKNNIQFVIVSIDVEKEFPKKIDQFLKRRKIKIPSFWLSDNDPNYFIPVISNEWQGSIPATIFVNNAKGIKLFVEEELSNKTLENYIKKIL